MAHISYSFCLTMLHSLWQAAVLLLLFILLNKTIIHKTNPGQKRNFLFLLLISQLILTVFTFYIYYTKNDNGFTYFIAATDSLIQNDIFQLLTPWIFTAYITALAYKATKVIYRWKKFQAQYKTGLQKPSADLKMFTRLNSNYFGIKRKVSLWLSTTVTAPVTFGFFKPVILLPVALVNNLTVQQAETLILHELTHIKANDYLLNWFLLFTETVFFFNPCILSICKKIRLEREKSCDVSVINFKYSPLVYAETLLLAERQKQLLIPSFQLAAVSNKQQLLHRIQYFSSHSNYNQRKKNGLFISLTGSFLVMLFCFFALLQPGTTGTDKISSTFVADKEENTSFIADAIDEMNNPVFINNLISNINDAKTAVAVSLKEIEKQKPFIEKQIKNLQPMLKKIQAGANEIKETVEMSFATPVALQEAEGTKQIIVKEEQSGSKNTSVKVYTVTYLNGQWVLIPEWRAAAKERMHDSSTKIDLSEQ